MVFKKNLLNTIAPPFPENLIWLNSGPLKLKDLKDKIILLDFWTYSCVNCIRTLPFIVKLHRLYADLGLVVIGVHSPEFGFEKDMANVESALKRFDIKYPVVLDNDYLVWNLYSNHWWPRKIILAPDKDKQSRFAKSSYKVVYDHIGEGAYDETELNIRKLLKKTEKELPAFQPNEKSKGGVCLPATEEIYLGYQRGQIGEPQELIQNQSKFYKISDNIVEHNWYLEGQWIAREEYIQHSRDLDDYKDFILLYYKAFSVNLVIKTRSGKKEKVLIELNGSDFKDKKGNDIIDEKSGSYLIVDNPRMYEIVKSGDFHEAKLKIFPLASDFQAFAFTFGNCG